MSMRAFGGRSGRIVAGVALTLAASAAAGCGDNRSAAAKESADQVAGEVRPPASIEGLRAKVRGKKIAVASAGVANPAYTTMRRTLQIMQSDFGVQVEYKIMESAPMNAALISGKLQVGHLSLGGMLGAVQAGSPLVAIGANAQKNAYMVIARKPINTLRQLKGKPFAVSQNLNSIVGQTGMKCLAGAGLDLKKDTQVLTMGNVGEITQALAKGTAAGGVASTYVQTEFDIEHPGRFSVLCRGAETNPQFHSIYSVSREWLKKNRDLALALSIAEIKAHRWARERQDEWVRLATATVPDLTGRAAGMDYRKFVNEMDTWPVNGSLDRALCDQTIATSKQFGVIKDPLKCADIATFRFQDAAVRFLGRK